MKYLLLPGFFRIIGWLIFIPSLTGGLLSLFGILDFSRHSSPLFHDLFITGVSLGALFVVCSKNKVEDEMTQSIRSASMFNSLYVYMGLLGVSLFSVGDGDWIRVMDTNVILFPVIYLIRYLIELRHYQKLNVDEE